MPDAQQTNPMTSHPSKNIRHQAEPPHPATSSSLYRWLLLITIILCVWRIFPGEVARWHFDAHRNHLLDNDAEQALSSIRKAIQWQPTNPTFWSALGGVEMELDNYPESWESFDRACQLIQDDEYHAYKDTAIAFAQNNSAYARALGNRELDRAKQDIDAALEVLPHTGSWLDTRGYIRLLQGDLEGALDDTYSAVTQTMATYRLRERKIKKQASEDVRRRRTNDELSDLNEGLAVLYGHRALAYEALGQTESAKRDFAFSETYQAKADHLKRAH